MRFVPPCLRERPNIIEEPTSNLKPCRSNWPAAATRTHAAALQMQLYYGTKNSSHRHARQCAVHRAHVAVLQRGHRTLARFAKAADRETYANSTAVMDVKICAPALPPGMMYFSSTSTLAPFLAISVAAVRPPMPLPTTTASQCCPASSGVRTGRLACAGLGGAATAAARRHLCTQSQTRFCSFAPQPSTLSVMLLSHSNEEALWISQCDV